MKTVKTLKLITSGFLLSALVATLAIAQAPPSGLEVSDATTVPVLNGHLTDRETQLGLSRDIIEARVNAVLRRNGLKPVEATGEEDHRCVVSVSVLRNSYIIHVTFFRRVTFNDGVRERRINAQTWAQFYQGTWNQSPAEQFKGAEVDSILKEISEMTEMFANEFLKANQK
jgi:hypothetical protein